MSRLWPPLSALPSAKFVGFAVTGLGELLAEAANSVADYETRCCACSGIAGRAASYPEQWFNDLLNI